MNSSPLQRIQNWPQLAHQAGYSVSALARACGVSARVLELFFLAAFGCEPRRSLKKLRMQRAVELLREGCNVNETAYRLGYHDHSHFSRELKKYYGISPKRLTRHANRGGIASFSHSATYHSHLATKM